MLHSALVLAALLLAACGGGGGTAAAPAAPAAAKITLMGGAMQGAPLSLASASAVVSTFAGSGVSGFADGTGTAATFNNPLGTTTDGTNLYVVDSCGTTGSNDIRKVVLATGVVTTLAGSAVAGSADGTGLAATFNCPQDITTDGNALYVADGNNMIRKIAPASGTLANMTSANAVVTTLAGSTVAGAADGTGTAASFNSPAGITTDGTKLYVGDSFNNKIRQIVIATGVVSSLTGVANTAGAVGAADGAGTAASFNYPGGITTDGTNLYVGDFYNNKIRQIVIATGVVSSLTGVANTAGAAGATDGTAAAASFNGPYGITTDGTNLYVVDCVNTTIRKIQ